MAIRLILACSLLLLSSNAFCYSLSFMVEQRVYPNFTEHAYSYSSLFRQGRDNFHWLDLSYASNDYVIKNEIGHADTIGSSYRFVQRQRWGRNFKPAVFVGAGLYRRNLTDRRMINANNFILGELPSDNRVGFNLNLGGGYLWEIKNFLLGFSLSVGYDFAYADRFYKTDLFFAYEL